MFEKVYASSGIEEYANIQEDIAKKSSELQSLYEEMEQKVKYFEKYEGYEQAEKLKEKLVKMKKVIEELSEEMYIANTRLEN